MKRYVFIGSINYSARCLDGLLGMGVNIVEIMCPEREACLFNSDYEDLAGIATAHGRKVRYFKCIGEEAGHIAGLKPDVIFVLGLSQLIPQRVLDAPTIGCIGSHPALLPANRGRHPIIWALVNGAKESGVTLFWIDKGIDSGDIWGQERFAINADDTALTVYKKVVEISIDILRKKIPELEDDIVVRIPQDHSKARYMRKRHPDDGRIDWSRRSADIHNLIRALTKPYCGAHCRIGERDVKIWKASIVDPARYGAVKSPGQVIDTEGRSIIVGTGDGAMVIEEHGFTEIPKTGDRL